MTSIINEGAFRDSIIKQLNADLLAAAEPILQEALKKIEVEMRAKMAQRLIAYMDNNFHIERNGMDLRIVIRQAVQ
jgi:hypothetical protein